MTGIDAMRPRTGRRSLSCVRVRCSVSAHFLLIFVTRLCQSPEKKAKKKSEAQETLVSLYKIWKRPVYIQTTYENSKRQIGFDGKNHTMEKV